LEQKKVIYPSHPTTPHAAVRQKKKSIFSDCKEDDSDSVEGIRGLII
jgi:hypothetical protein